MDYYGCGWRLVRGHFKWWLGFCELDEIRYTDDDDLLEVLILLMFVQPIIVLSIYLVVDVGILKANNNN